MLGNTLTRIEALQVLKLDNNASPREIRVAYLHRSMEIHPDKNPNKPNSKEAFQRLRDAYEVLSQNKDGTSQNSVEAKQDATALYSGELCVHLFVMRGIGSIPDLLKRVLEYNLPKVNQGNLHEKYDAKLKSVAAKPRFGGDEIVPEDSSFSIYFDSSCRAVGYQDWQGTPFHAYFLDYQSAAEYLANPKRIWYQSDMGGINNFPIVFLVNKKNGDIVDIFSGGSSFQSDAHLYQLPTIDQRKVARGLPETDQRTKDFYEIFHEEKNIGDLINQIKNLMRLNINKGTLLRSCVELIADRNLKNNKYLIQIMQSEQLLATKALEKCDKAVVEWDKDDSTKAKAIAMQDLIKLIMYSEDSFELFLKTDLKKLLAQKESKEDEKKLNEFEQLIRKIAETRIKHTVFTFLNANNSTETAGFRLLLALQVELINFGKSLQAMLSDANKVALQHEPIRLLK